MKKFQFSLDKLKGYREQILDKEKNDLAHLRSQQQSLMDEKSRVEESLRLSNEEFIQKSSSGISVLQISMFKSYHQSLSQQIKELEASIEKMELRVQKQLDVVVEATKEVSSLEKLEEKQLEDYNFRMAKAEEQFVSEYVINSTYR